MHMEKDLWSFAEPHVGVKPICCSIFFIKYRPPQIQLAGFYMESSLFFTRVSKGDGVPLAHDFARKV